MTNITICSRMGISELTPVVVKEIEPGKFSARMGIAVFSPGKMSKEQLQACDYDPFHPDFHDNYAAGVGASEDEARQALNKDLDELEESMWL